MIIGIGIRGYEQHLRVFLDPIINELINRGHTVIDNQGLDQKCDLTLVSGVPVEDCTSPRMLFVHSILPIKGVHFNNDIANVFWKRLSRLEYFIPSSVEEKELVERMIGGAAPIMPVVAYPKIDSYKPYKTGNKIGYMPTFNKELNADNIVLECAKDIRKLGYELLVKEHGIKTKSSLSNIPLLNESDIVITDFSASGQEAIMLGIPTIYVRQEKNKDYKYWKYASDKNLYSRKIEKLGYIVHSKEELLEKIKYIRDNNIGVGEPIIKNIGKHTGIAVDAIESAVEIERARQTEKISFIMPTRNNLEYVKQAYNSIRQIEIKHPIILLDDASTDGTWEWMQSIQEKDDAVQLYKNYGNDRVGHTILYDVGVKMCNTEIFSIFHADMITSKNYVKNAIKHLHKGRVVAGTRIEPPLHPPGPEKIIFNLGMGSEEFDEKKFNEIVSIYEQQFSNQTTFGLFAPWMMYKEDFLAIGGHDILFAPMELEDSDIFNRFVLAKYGLIQSRDAFVYHMTCRGSRFKDGIEIEKEIPLPDGTIWYKPKDSEEYKELRQQKFREWHRKWHSDVLHDSSLYPVIKHKYNIAFIIKNCSKELLYQLEPWADYVLVDFDPFNYIVEENVQSRYAIQKRVGHGEAIRNNVINDFNIIAEFDGQQLKTQEQFNQITINLSDIITSVNDGEDIGNGVEFEWDIFHMLVKSFETYENDNIINKSINNKQEGYNEK